MVPIVETKLFNSQSLIYVYSLRSEYFPHLNDNIHPYKIKREKHSEMQINSYSEKGLNPVVSLWHCHNQCDISIFVNPFIPMMLSSSLSQIAQLSLVYIQTSETRAF